MLADGNDTDTVYNMMRRLLIVLVASLCLVDAFVNSNPRQHHSNVMVHKSRTSTQEEVVHPHSKLWETTLESNNNNSSFVSGIDLVVRSPSDGGTGILAVDDIPKDTACMTLNLEQVGKIDASSILDSYNEDEEGRDEVFAILKEMWNKEFAANTENTNSDEGKRLAVLAGIIAHLQLTRYKDMKDITSEQQEEGSEGISYALKESRRLGLFLDAMPLLPQHNNEDKHPFPTHYLYWNDDEIQTLLQGTMGQTKAREVRAGIGLVIREWSAAFLSEHSSLTQTDILNSIFSAFTAVLSRSFGDGAGRDVDGKGRMLVPLVDMLNHDSEYPNVKWQWNVGEGDDELIAEGNGEIVVTTLRNVKKGEELLKCYGWRPAWDIASSYGFVPRLKKQRWECAVIPLFPSVLDLSPDSLPTPNNMDEDKVDLLLETNYGPLVQAVLAAVNAANEIKARQQSDTEAIEDENQSDDRPNQLNRLEVVSLFVPASEPSEYPFPLRRPCVVVGTKIHVSSSDTSNHHHHRTAIESILPAYRAAASAISQLRDNHEKSDASPIEASQMAMAAASLDKDVDWDTPALELINEGINDRIQTLVSDGKATNTWLAKQNDASGMNDHVAKEHRQLRADMAKDVRHSELMVLQTLQKTATEMLSDSSLLVYH